jgi:hypothetical protein
MKKFLAIIAIASFAVACNSSSEKKETTDSLTNKIDSAANATTDSIEVKSDSLKNAIDSAASAAKDSVKANN